MDHAPSDSGSAAAERPLVVTVVRSGGIAGMRRRWRAQPSAADLPRWRELVAGCPWDAPVPAATGADRYTWHIVAEDGARPREAALPDGSLDGPWRRLVDAVRGVS